MTAVQERVNDAFQARVSGLMEALLTAAVGVGFLAGGTVASLAGARAVYLTAGLGSRRRHRMDPRAPARAREARARARRARPRLSRVQAPGGGPLGVRQTAASISQKERMPSRS